MLRREVGPLGVRVTIVEPGGFRTDWAGSSMRMDPFNEAYEPTIGVMRAHRGGAHSAHGDPVKGARAIMQLAALNEPPLRLLLGSDAVFIAKATLAQRAAEDERVRELSLSTDFDGMPNFADTPFAKMLAGKS